MSEGPKSPWRWLLLAELVGGGGFGIAVAAYFAGIPVSLRLGMNLPAVIALRVAFFALVVSAFNLAVAESRRGHRIRGLVLLAAAACLVPILLLISFPQY